MSSKIQLFFYASNFSTDLNHLEALNSSGIKYSTARLWDNSDGRMAEKSRCKWRKIDVIGNDNFRVIWSVGQIAL